METIGAYQFDVPELTDIPDVPSHLTSLATQVDDLLTGKRFPLTFDNDVQLGSFTNLTQRVLSIRRLIGTDQWELRVQIDSATDPWVLGSMKNGVWQSRLTIRPTGQTMVATGSQWRPVPFAMQSQIVNVPVAGVNFGTANVVLEPGRFTQVPIPFCTSSNSLWLVGKSPGWTVTGGPVYARSWSGSVGGAGGSVDVHVLCVQMTPGNSQG